MILLYHKVETEALTEWWVSIDAFDRQMAALAACDVVNLDDYDASNPLHVVITFDGVYENVYEYAFPILKKWGYPFELFVTGHYIGGDNGFDTIEPRADFCSIEQLQIMAHAGGRVQWHTSTHQRLQGLSESQLIKEIRVPDSLRAIFPLPHMDWFAYPHGDHGDEAVAFVRAHFKGGLSCNAGNGERHQLNRRIVLEDTKLDRTRVSVIIANHNYGAFLPEAMDSVLNQSVMPDEIILIDDCSTDGSQEVARRYADVARVVLNEQNLGIVGNFNKAVGMATCDYVAILGADNRMRCDYVERCKVALDRNPAAAVAYTDMTIFGPRAAELARRVGATKLGQSLAERWPVYRWAFPEPTHDALADLPTTNFIHGSSMYRRSVWLDVGGYAISARPEDHSLFLRMLGSGWSAVRVPYPVIEYRQHSSNQANTVLGLQMEIARLANLAQHAVIERDRQTAALQAEITRIKRTVSWQITKPLRFLVQLVVNPRKVYAETHGRVLALLKPIEQVAVVPFGYEAVKWASMPKIAVICHMYYIDMADEFKRYLLNIPFLYKLYITTDSEKKRESLERQFSNWKGEFEIRIAPNRGRDIAPAIITCLDIYTRYEYLLHIHTKKSPHHHRLGRWRQYLMESLLGSTEVVESIFEAFRTSSHLGMIAPQHFEAIRNTTGWGKNFKIARQLARKMGIEISRNGPIEFPSGSMFWARTAALRPLLDSKLSIDDFPHEVGQVDETLAHAIERLFYFSCEQAGYRWLKISHSNFLGYSRGNKIISNHTDLEQVINDPSRRLIK